jgi:hypothetical protein
MLGTQNAPLQYLLGRLHPGVLTGSDALSSRARLMQSWRNRVLSAYGSGKEN